MAQHGGPRTPTNPAAVSGPGALSKRTDGKQPIMDIPSSSYGDGVQTQAIQAGAPMAAVGMPSAPSAAPSGPPAAAPVMPTPLTAGSVLPDQPVTHGADSGPGPDSSSLNLGNPVQTQHSSALSLIQAAAQSPTASPAIQYLAQTLSQGF